MTTKKRDKANYLIQSVTHALDVLEELCKAGGEIGVTELSKRLKLHKNNVFRLLATLELRGYVDQNLETEDYRLGVKALQLGQSYLLQSSLVARATPILKSLADSLGETASLAILQNGSIQYPVTIEGKKPVKVAPRIGVSFSAKVSAVGRLLTAQLSDAVLTELLAQNTVHDAAIKSMVTELRTSGQIVDRGGIEADVVSACKIVRGNNGDVIGAIEVLIPQYRLNLQLVQQKLDEAAAQLSTSLGSAAKSPMSQAIEKEIVSGAATASAAMAARVIK